MKGALVGIDLGTTYSLVSVMMAGRPVVLPNALGEILTPSAVHVSPDGSISVGALARAKATLEPERTALAFKRDMGTDRIYDLGAKKFRAEELSALVLRALKSDAEMALGEPIAEAVVTVPAYFGELQRRATHDACAMADLHVERIINEPTAAALAYGLHQQDRELRAVVLDLGGGTFDVTVLEIMEGVIEIQSSAGDARLGGEDFLDLTVHHCSDRLRHEGIELASKASQARLRDACEQCKRRLSTDERTLLALPALTTTRGVLDVELVLERAELEQIFRPLLARMAAPIQRALRDAQKTPGDIQEVLLVGGATRMPCVSMLGAELFGRLPLRELPPDEAVALGAAVQVALKSGERAVADLVTTDVAPFSLGIASTTQVAGNRVLGLFSPILERGTVLPASRVQRYQTVNDGQTELHIEVYQGEHSLCSENQKLGDYHLKGIPRAEAGKESVDIRFTYDMNGVLDIDATVVSTGKMAVFTIEQSPGRLTKRQIEEARGRLSRLKFHPKEALPNVTTLARAEALYVEVVGPRRDTLGQRIAAFRAALDAQDPTLIEQQREFLNALILELRKSW